MHIQNRIDSGVQNGKEIRFLLAESIDGPDGFPTGKMITDTDEFSFVYLFDEEEGYRYIHFPREVWPLMVEALKGDADPILTWKENLIPLKGFKEEMMMLIQNIKGNDNYGEAFSTAVEIAFDEVLLSVE